MLGNKVFYLFFFRLRFHKKKTRPTMLFYQYLVELNHLFWLFILFLTVLNIIYCIFTELKNKTYFKLHWDNLKKNNLFILDYSVLRYGPFEFLSDLIIMVKTIKIKPVLLLKISLSYILIKILKYLPLVYALMFFYHTLSQVAQLFKAWWKKEKLVIQPIVINIRGLNDCLLYFAYLPKIWSFIVIYNAIAFKQGKVPKEAINVFFFP
jgi:hypothetical protein